MILTHPSGDKWYQGQPEKQIRICPHNCPVYMIRSMKHMMVVVPVNAYIYEAKNITKKYGEHWLQSRQLVYMRNPHFQDHNRNYNCDNPVTECFDPSCTHIKLLFLFI